MPSNNGPIEAGAVLSLAISSVPNAISYNWTGPNGFTSSSRNTSVTNFSADNAGVYTITISAGANCNYTATTSVSMANCDIYISSANASGEETYELARSTSTTNTFEPLTLTITPFEGQSNFSAYNIQWMYEGDLLVSVPKAPVIQVDKPGDYRAILTLKMNPSTICEAEVHIKATPCYIPPTPDSCGTNISIQLTNGLAEGVSIAPGDQFTVGDFLLTVTSITSGSKAGWKGKGHVTMRLPMNIEIGRFSVLFTDAVINDCYELASGKVESEYDPNWGGFLDLDAIIDDVREIAQEIKSCFKSAEDYLVELQDNIANFQCTEEDRNKINKNLENIKNAKACFETSGGLNVTEIEEFYNKIDAVIASCNTCLINCSNSGARVRSDAVSNCEIIPEINNLINDLENKGNEKEALFKVVIRDPQSRYYDLENFKFLNHNNDRKTYFSSQSLNGAPLGFDVGGTEYLWKGANNNYYEFTGFNADKTPIWTSNSFTYSLATEPKYYYRFAYHANGDCEAEVVKIANEIVQAKFKYPGCQPKSEKVKAEPKKEEVVCPTRPTNITPQSLVDALYWDERYANCLSFLTLPQRKQLIFEILSKSLVITECLPSTPLGNCYEPLIRNILISTPAGDEKAILEELKDKKLLQKLFNHLQFGTFDKVLSILTDWIVKEYPTDKLDISQFIVTKSNGDIDRATSSLLSYGFGSNNTFANTDNSNRLIFRYNILVNNLVAEQTTTVENPYDYVLVYFNEDYPPLIDEIAYQKGKHYVMPAINAYLLFNQSQRNKIIQFSKTTLDIGLLALGVGEITAAYKVYQTGRAAYATYLMTKSCLDMGFGIADLYIQNALAETWKNTPEGQARLDRWNQINMIYSMASFGTTLGDNLIDAAKRRHFAGNQIDDEAKFDNFADEVLNISTLVVRGATKEDLINSVPDFANGLVSLDDLELT